MKVLAHLVWWTRLVRYACSSTKQSGRGQQAPLKLFAREPLEVIEHSRNQFLPAGILRG
jgi:hypothetical protein